MLSHPWLCLKLSIHKAIAWRFHEPSNHVAFAYHTKRQCVQHLDLYCTVIKSQVWELYWILRDSLSQALVTSSFFILIFDMHWQHAALTRIIHYKFVQSIINVQNSFKIHPRIIIWLKRNCFKTMYSTVLYSYLLVI